MVTIPHRRPCYYKHRHLRRSCRCMSEVIVIKTSSLRTKACCQVLQYACEGFVVIRGTKWNASLVNSHVVWFVLHDGKVFNHVVLKYTYCHFSNVTAASTHRILGHTTGLQFENNIHVIFLKTNWYEQIQRNAHNIHDWYKTSPTVPMACLVRA